MAAGLSGAAFAQTPLNSAFTYQGLLENASGPIDGTADVVVRLYGAASGGTALGTVNLNNVSLAGGLLNRTLDFGASAITTDARWLEFDVRSPAGSGTFTTLAPRQLLSGAPVSWYAINARNAERPWQLTSEQGYILPLPTNVGTVNGVGIGLGGGLPTARLHVRTGAFFPAESARIEDYFGRSQLRISTPESQGRATLQAWSGEANVAGPLSLNEGGGNVGVGTGSPTSRLDVAGTLEADGFKLNGNGAAAGRVLVCDAAGAATWQPSASSLWITNGNDIGYTAGNVGIGTTSPQMALDVRLNDIIGSSATSIGQHDTSNRGTKVSLGYRVLGTTEFVGMRSLIGPGTNGCGNTADIRFDTWECGIAPSREVMRITGRGNVCIGTPAPAFPLHVNTATNVAANIQSNSTVGTWLNLQNSSAGGRFWQMISTGSANGGGAGNLVFANGTNPGVADGIGLAITNSLNVGIGTLTPAAKLDVVGTARVGVLQITGGADVAEPFNVNTDCEVQKQEIQPGMVVAIDSARIGELRLADTAFDKTVAGIISGANGVNTGLMLTQEGSVADGKHPVALSGRVWAWCDADAAGPIEAGDMLTTSHTPGHAMRVADHSTAAGAIIGKAMSPLPSGKGLVLVLVSLQ